MTAVRLTADEASAVRTLLESEVLELAESPDPEVREGGYRRHLEAVLVRCERAADEQAA